MKNRLFNKLEDEIEFLQEILPDTLELNDETAHCFFGNYKNYILYEKGKILFYNGYDFGSEFIFIIFALPLLLISLLPDQAIKYPSIIISIIRLISIFPSIYLLNFSIWKKYIVIDYYDKSIYEQYSFLLFKSISMNKLRFNDIMDLNIESKESKKLDLYSDNKPPLTIIKIYSIELVLFNNKYIKFNIPLDTNYYLDAFNEELAKRLSKALQKPYIENRDKSLQLIEFNFNSESHQETDGGCLQTIIFILIISVLLFGVFYIRKNMI